MTPTPPAAHSSRRGLVAGLALLLTTLGCWAAGDLQPADTVFRGARIYTVDVEQPWAEAMAIHEGRVVAIGSAADVEAAIGPDTEIIDLGGRFVMPGLHDAHLHTQMVAEFEANLSVDPDQAWDDIAKTIREHAASHPDEEWILGGNLPWLDELIGEGPVRAHREVLDELAPDHAISLWDVGGHAMLANSRALELAGITPSTPDPPGGTIERDAEGRATGVLRELATNLILENADSLSVDDYAAGIRAAFDQLLALGITSVHETWCYPDTLRALAQLSRTGDLPLRVTAAIAHPVEFTTALAKRAAEEALEQRASFEGARLKVPYVKFVLDGSAGGQTLVLTEPYVGTDFRGEMRNAEEIVRAEVKRLHGMGVGSVLHGVGDGAIRVALDAVESAIAEHGDNGTRHILAHTVFVNPADLDRFADLGVIAEFSPYFWAPSEGQEMLRGELGEERLGWGFPMRALLDRGTHVAAGSDWPVVYDPNPFPAIEAMVTRQLPGGSDAAFGAEHAITLDEALRAFTLGGAYSMHQENDLGSLAPGKLADFVVLDRNLFEVPVTQIHQTRVELTVVEGEIVYRGPEGKLE